MIHYRTGIAVQEWTLLGKEVHHCELRLLRENQLQLVEDGNWSLVWRGGRSGDGKVYSLYQN
jgi:hypothetical protein